MVLFLLLFIFGAAIGLVTALSAAFLGRPRVAAAVGTFLVVWLVLYLSVLGWFSHRSEARTVAPAEEYRLAGLLLDAHLLFSVDQVKQTEVSEKDSPTQTKEIRYVVTLRYRNDARRVEVSPPALELTIVDAAGGRFQSLSDPADLPTLRPGESGFFEAAFELPLGVQEPRLLLRSQGPLDRWLGSLIIDGEESLGHQKTSFRLPPIAPRTP